MPSTTRKWSISGPRDKLSEGFIDFANIGADYGNLGQLTGIQTTGGMEPRRHQRPGL